MTNSGSFLVNIQYVVFPHITDVFMYIYIIFFPGPDGKKGGHTATPHPAKGGGKAAVNGSNTKAQTPKSGGQFACKSCERCV